MDARTKPNADDAADVTNLGNGAYRLATFGSDDNAAVVDPG